MGETQRVVKARGVTPGRATGLMLLSGRPFMFAHGVEPSTGKVTDIRSDILGKNVKGKVLVFPTGKGSTTGSAWLLEAIRQGNGPVWPSSTRRRSPSSPPRSSWHACSTE